MAQAKTVYVNKRNKIKTPAGDKVFYTLVNIGLAIFTLIVLIPLVNIVSCSFSSVDAVKFGYVTVYPVDFSIEGYKAVFGYHGIGRSYLNTVWYTLLGTAINLVMTMVTAYPLARKRLPFHGLITFLFMFTMYFGGGTIPNYLLVKSLGFYDTVWALVVPGALSVYNMIIARTFINNIPAELGRPLPSTAAPTSATSSPWLCRCPAPSSRFWLCTTRSATGTSTSTLSCI